MYTYIQAIPSVREEEEDAATQSKHLGVISKQLTLPDLVPKAPPAARKSKDPLELPKVTSTTTLPGIIHHQKIRNHQVFTKHMSIRTCMLQGRKI